MLSLLITRSAVKNRLLKRWELLREELWREMEETLRDMLPSVREWKQKDGPYPLTKSAAVIRHWV